MEDNVSNNEIIKPTLHLNECGIKVVGESYTMKGILKDSFIIRINNENIDTILNTIEKAKNQPLKVVVIGNNSSLGTETFRAVLKSSLPLTMIVEDFQRDEVNPKEPWNLGVVAATLALSSCQTNKPNPDISELKANPIEYNIDADYRGDNVSKKTRSCSNKKIKKRKKAKNGKGGKK